MHGGAYDAAMYGNLFIGYLQTDPAYFFAVVITVVISITLHELAHGYAAIKLGDDTPIFTGHMTMNPLVHMGGISLLLLAMMGIAFGAMPVDRTRLRGKYGEAIMAGAGPATNFVLAALAYVGLGLWERFDHTPYAQWTPAATNGKYLLLIFAMYNFLLGLFNLIPLPPLDGSWIAANVFPAYRRWLSHDLVRGVASALMFAAFLVGGYVLTPVALKTTLKIEQLISSRSEFHFAQIFRRISITNPEQAKEDDETVEMFRHSPQLQEHYGVVYD
ncbi:MAG: peptidase [Phycisphaerales bacterium]|nr:peptidase [Phycisphaerales bacterium]